MLNTNSKPFFSAHCLDISCLILPPIFCPNRWFSNDTRRYKQINRSSWCAVNKKCALKPLDLPLWLPPSVTAALIIDALPVIWSSCPAAYSVGLLTGDRTKSGTKISAALHKPRESLQVKKKKNHLMIHNPNSCCPNIKAHGNSRPHGIK